MTSSLITGFREGLGLSSQTYSAKYLDLKTKRPTAHRNELADKYSTCVFFSGAPSPKLNPRPSRLRDLGK